MPPSAVDHEHLVESGEERPLAFWKPVDDTEMDITPMIDMTFLLLIFFLVASRMDENTRVELPPARYGTVVAEKSSIPITITRGSGDAANVYLADGQAPDRQASATDLTAQEEAIVAYIQSGLESGKEHVLIKAEKNVKHRDVARVSAAVGKAGSGDLYVAVLEIQ